GFHYVAMHGAPPAYTTLGKPLVVLSEHPYTPLTEAVRTKQAVHISDLSTHQSYLKQDPRIVALVNAAGARNSHCAYAQGRRADRRYCHLSSGSTPVNRQTDRAGAELRRTGRHRH